MTLFLRKIALLVTCLMVVSSFSIGEKPNHSVSDGCLWRNSWILAKTLQGCYGDDSIKSWCLDSLKFTINMILNDSGYVSDIRSMHLKSKFKKRNPIDLSKIKSYLIDNKVRFGLCSGGEALYDFGYDYLDSIFNISISSLNYNMINIGFMGADLYNYDNSMTESVDMVLNSLNMPFYMISNLNIGSVFDRKYTAEEYNEAILMSSLVYLYGDWEVWKLYKQGIHLKARLVLDEYGVPSEGVILCCPNNINKLNLLEELLSAWKLYNIYFAGSTDLCSSEIVVSLNGKVKNWGEFNSEYSRTYYIPYSYLYGSRLKDTQ